MVNDIYNNVPTMSDVRYSEPHREDDASRFLKELIHTYQSLRNAFGRAVGINSSRLSVMHVLHDSQPQGIGVLDMARSLNVNAAAVTRQLKEMEVEDLIKRTADPRDRRRSFVRLTPKGRRLLMQMHVRGHEFERELVAGIPQDHITIALRVLEQTRAALNGPRQGLPWRRGGPAGRLA